MKSSLIIFFLALAVRLIYLFLMIDGPFFGVPYLDELSFYSWSMDIASGNFIGSEVFFRAPLYPYLVAGIFSIVGSDLFIIYLIQYIGGSLACLLIYRLTLEIFQRRPIAITAGILAAINPVAIFFEGQLMDIWLQEIFGPALILTGLWAFRSEEPDWRRYFVFGLIGGLSAIARPMSVPFYALVFILWKLLAPAGTHRSWRYAFIVMGGFVLLILPVTIRNAAVGRCFTPIATYAGINFWIGNNSHANGHSAVVPEIRTLGDGKYESVEAFANRKAQEVVGRSLNAAEIQNYWFKEGFREIFSDPIRFVRLSWRKFILFWSSTEITNNRSIYMEAEFNPLMRLLLIIAGNWIVFPLGILGLAAGRGLWQRSEVKLFLLMLFVLIAGVVAFFINIRYRFPFGWLLIPWSAFGFWLLIDTLKLLTQKNKSSITNLPLRPAVTITILIATIIFVNVDWCGVKNHRKSAYNYWTTANCWRDKGEFERAAEYHQKALDIAPTYAQALLNLGEVKYLSGENNAARDKFEKIIRQYKKNPSSIADSSIVVRAYNNLGVVLESEDELTSATLMYREATKIDPNYENSWVNMGDALLAMDDLTEAKAAYNRVFEINAGLQSVNIQSMSCARAHLGIAIILSRDNDLDTAANELRQALEIGGEAIFKEAQKHESLQPVIAALIKSLDE